MPKRKMKKKIKYIIYIEKLSHFLKDCYSTNIMEKKWFNNILKNNFEAYKNIKR